MFRIGTRNRTAEPCAGKQLDRPVVLDELAPGGFVLFADFEHLILFFSVCRTAVKNPFGHVDGREGGRIFLHEGAAQRHQATGVIVVVMRQDHVAHVAQINVQFADVRENEFRTRSGVHQDAMTIGLDERGKAPLSNAIVGEHGGEHRDFQGLHLSVRGGL